MTNIYFISVQCPEQNCDWDSGDYGDMYKDEMFEEYSKHWHKMHCLPPPPPHSETWNVEKVNG